MTGVVIIGSGPAGLGAAEVLARAGVGPVTVLERQAQAGGIPRLCGHSPFGMREFRRVLGGASYARNLQSTAERAGAQLLLNHSVTGIDADLTVHVTTPQGPITLRPDRILLATGAREASRAERLLPGDRPLGVITTGALQDMWFGRHALPFRRPAILGSELVAMSALLTCHQAKAKPVAMIEPSPATLARAPFRWLPKLMRIPMLSTTTISDMVAKNGRLNHLVLQDAKGVCRKLECDGLVLSGDFRPEAGLARLCGLVIDPATRGPIVDQSGRTSRPQVYAAGNLLRSIETAGQCWAEGRAVATALLADLAKAASPAIEITAGAGLRYVMPQRLTPDASTALPTLQIRLDRIAAGTLTLRDSSGRALLCYQTRSAPERRLGFALDHPALTTAQGPLTIALEAR